VDRPDLRFLEARQGFTFDASGFILLTVDAPVISPGDAALPLLILDSTWRLLPGMMACLTGDPVKRALPHHLRTAYPRVSKLSPDPPRGLASVEALYAARRLMGRSVAGLLDHYHWRSEFLSQFRNR
jgi:pre-rRNA-processing protein TSR3